MKSQFKVVPEGLSRQMLRLTNSDWLVIGILAIIGLNLYDRMGLIGIGITIALGAIVLDQGDDVRNYDYALFKLPAALNIRRKKGVRWKEGSGHGVITDRIKELPGTDMALIYQDGGDENSVSIIIESEGSHTYSGSLDDMVDIQSEMASDLMSISVKRNWEVEVGYLLRPRPWDPRPQRAYEATAFTTDVLLPLKVLPGHNQELTEADELAWEQFLYTQELEDVFRAEGATTVTMAYVVTIHRKGGDKRRKTPIYADQIAKQPIVEIAQRAINLLHARGVQRPRIVDVPHARKYYRESWDVLDLDDFRERLATGTLSPTEHWPQQKIITTRSRIITDNTWHALIRITNTAKVVGPLYMRQIFGTKLGPDGRPAVPNRSVAVVTQTMRSRRIYWATGLIIDVVDAIRDYLKIARVRPGARAKATSRQDKEQEAYDNPNLQLYTILVLVSGSESEIDDLVQAQLEYYDTCKTITAREVVTLEPILYTLFMRASRAIM